MTDHYTNIDQHRSTSIWCIYGPNMQQSFPLALAQRPQLTPCVFVRRQGRCFWHTGGHRRVAAPTGGRAAAGESGGRFRRGRMEGWNAMDWSLSSWSFIIFPNTAGYYPL